MNMLGRRERDGTAQHKRNKRRRTNTNKSEHNSVNESVKSINQDIQALREQLPVYQARDRILNEIQNAQTVVIVGETGSGKTTQIPQFLHEAGFTNTGMVAVTQPRRVAAISIANRVAQEMGCVLGQDVGYSIRFEDVSSAKTCIKYMTDGMLLRELLTDADLNKYSVIVLDEAHERTLRTDVLFGAVKAIQRRRPALKVVVMSATLNASAFAAYFNAKIINVPGRLHPVKIFYTGSKQDDHVDASLVAIMQIHKEQPPGDILAFLTGQEEIENLEKLLNEQAKTLPPESQNLLVCPIFASLPTSQQTKVFERAPPGTRKVVLSTNIAETSITISGIRYVVDSGMVKMRAHNPTTGIETLSVQPISKASAAQRSGRAGREAPGICFRLYTEDAFKGLCEETEPEIKRCNLSMVLLLLKASGIDDVANFDFMDRPSRTALINALETLYALGALSDEGALTDLGRQMAAFPLDPPLAKVLIASKALKCTSEAVSVVAMLSVEPVFFAPADRREAALAAKKKFVSFDGDHATLLNAARAYEAAQDAGWCADNFISGRSMRQMAAIRRQLSVVCGQMGIDASASCGGDGERLLRCLLAGLFRNVAVRQHDGSFRTLVSRQTVHIHPSSVLFGARGAAAVMFSEWVHTSRQYLRNVSVVQPSWLHEAAPQYYARNSFKTTNVVVSNPSTGASTNSPK